MIKYKPIFKHIYRTQMIRANACMPYGRFVYYDEDGTAKPVLHPAELRKPFGRFIEINLSARGKRRYNSDQKYSLNNMSEETIRSLRNKPPTRSVPEPQPQIDTEPILSAQPTGSPLERLIGMGTVVRPQHNMPATVPSTAARFDGSQAYADRTPDAVVNLDNNEELADVESMDTQTTDTRLVVNPLQYVENQSSAAKLQKYMTNVINHRSYKDMRELYNERSQLLLDDSLDSVKWFTEIDPVVFRNLAYAFMFSSLVPKQELVKFMNSTTEIATLKVTAFSPRYERYLLLVFVALLNDSDLLNYATEQSAIKTVIDITEIASMDAYIERLNEFEKLTVQKHYHVTGQRYLPRRGFLEVRLTDPETRVITLFTADYKDFRYVPPSNIIKHALTFEPTVADNVVGPPSNELMEYYTKQMRENVQA